MTRRRIKKLALYARQQLNASDYHLSDVRKHDAIISAAYLALDDPKPYPYELDRIWQGMRSAHPAMRSPFSTGIVFA